MRKTLLTVLCLGTLYASASMVYTMVLVKLA